MIDYKEIAKGLGRVDKVVPDYLDHILKRGKMKRITVIIFIITINATLAFAAGEIRFNPPYVVQTNSNKHIEIVSLKNSINSKGEYALIYQTSRGSQGAIKPANIKNLKGLIAGIERAKNQRHILKKKMYRPASNKQHETYKTAQTPSPNSVMVKNRESDISNKRRNAKMKNGRSAIINGEWDTQGRHYRPAGGGNAWRSDGTFMQKAAGGYIDTGSGEFVPAN